MIYALAGIAAILLVVMGLTASFVAKRQSQERQRKTQIKKWRSKANELYDTLKELALFDDNSITWHLISDYTNDLLKKIEDAGLNDGFCDALREELNQLNQTAGTSKIRTVVASDMELKNAKRAFNMAGKVIKSCAKQAKIGSQEAIDLKRQLELRALTLEVNTYLALAEDRVANNDTMSASGYFKHAKNMLVNTNLKFKGKSDKIRDIGDRMRALFGDEDARNRLAEKTDEQEKPAFDEHGFPTGYGDGEKKKF
jgi:hypothetical protein